MSCRPPKFRVFLLENMKKVLLFKPRSLLGECGSVYYLLASSTRCAGSFRIAPVALYIITWCFLYRATSVPWPLSLFFLVHFVLVG
ncbi:hypothetical protein LY78DRAFT_444754 [Colletotrichum sublineola]|nr:hypothetical protein LY78DRAFT_444754 [Colletotrichum sublineola]